MSEDLDWTEDGPRSRRYGDIYFSDADGLAESRAVYLQGCGLPDAWAGRRRFTVAELGFGTGLNIAALLELWGRTRAPGGRLSIFSVEAHPLPREAAARALARWPDALVEAVDALLDAWPEPRAGLQRLDLPGFDATLDLYVGEVGEALARWSGPADAWFLDGFSPAKNPQMWRDEVLAAVGRLSAPDARAASFTVAGHVRRGLAAAGFHVDKRAGFAAKRERLEARLPAGPGLAVPAPRVAIIGAGIGGAALARAFARLQVTATVIEASGAGAGASGNPAALVTPRLDAGFGPAAELHAQAFARAAALYRRETPGAVIAEGAVQLGRAARDAERFARLCAWDGFRHGGLTALDAVAVGDRLHEAPEGEGGALHIADALVIEPAAALDAWLAGTLRLDAAIARLERREGAWACLDATGELVAEAEVVCVAAGAQADTLVDGLGLRPVRGQADYTHEAVFSGEPAAWGAYAVPTRGGGVLFGASHLRGDTGLDLRPEETKANLAALAARRPALAARVQALAPGRLHARAGVRATTPDHLPLGGGCAPGLYVLGGFGGRGFSLAPLLAEHVAALATGVPSPLPVDLAARLEPLRFAPNRERL